MTVVDVPSIKSAFEEFDCDDENVWDSAYGIATQLQLSAQELADRYELFAIKRKALQAPVTAQLFSLFVEQLKKEQTKAHETGQTRAGLPTWTADTCSAPAPRPSKPLPPVTSTGHKAQVGNIASPAVLPTLPAQPTRSPAALTGAQFTYETRALLNKDLHDVTRDEGSDSCGADISVIGPTMRTPFRTLGCSVATTALALEDRISAVEAAAVARGWTLDAAHAASTEDVHVVGRICTDTPGRRANERTLFLEGSRATSSGARVKLDVSVLTSFSVFPGQIVAIRGRNPSGSCVIAHEILGGLGAVQPGPPPHCDPHCDPRSALAESELADAPASAHAGRIVVAAGPYTSDACTTLTSLHAVIGFCKQHHPDIVILLGPFIDDENTSWLQLKTTFEQYFQEQITGPLTALQSEVPGMRILLQPSCSDAHHVPVHPQPPFPAADSLTMLPSPAHLSIRGLRCTLSVTTSSVLTDLSALEVSRQAAQHDRFATLYRHVLSQQHLYPIFPHAENACIDYTYESALKMPSSPDVLILPSKLAPSTRVLEPEVTPSPTGGAGPTTVCMNPGPVSRGETGGFLDLSIGKADLDSQKPDAKDISARLKVDLVTWKLQS